jgi:hypothetical protein
VFEQYLHRGLFQLSDGFLKYLAKSLEGQLDSPTNQNFFFGILLRHQSQEKCIELMKDHKESYRYLMQYLISGYKSNPEKNKAAYLNTVEEVADGSSFIPLSVFLHAIKDDQNYKFLAEAAKISLNETFGLGEQVTHETSPQ